MFLYKKRKCSLMQKSQFFAHETFLFMCYFFCLPFKLILIGSKIHCKCDVFYKLLQLIYLFFFISFSLPLYKQKPSYFIRFYFYIFCFKKCKYKYLAIFAAKHFLKNKM